MARGQIPYGQRERCLGSIGRSGRLLHRDRGVQHLEDPLGGVPGAPPVLHGERQPRHRLERGERGEHDDGQRDARQPARVDGLDRGHRRRGDRQPAQQRRQPGAGPGDGGRAGGDPGQVPVRAPYRIRTGGEGTGHRQLGGTGEHIDDTGGQPSAGGGHLPLRPPGQRTREHRHPHTREQQPDGEDRAGLGQQPSGETDRAGADQHRRPCGQQPAEEVVLSRIDIGHQPRQQIATAALLEPGRRQPLQPPEDGDAYVGEHPEHRVMGDQPLGVPEDRTADTERPGRGHRHHQIEHRRLLCRPRDQPAGGRHQAHRTAQREASEQQRHRELRPMGTGRPAQPGERRAAAKVGLGAGLRARVRSLGLGLGLGGVPVRSGRFHGRLRRRSHRGRSLARSRTHRFHRLRTDRRPHRLRQPHHPVRHRQQRRPVHDEQDRTADREPADRGHDRLLGGAVQVRGGLVQEQDRTVGEEGAGEREALALAGREPGTGLAEPGRHAVRQRVDEVQRARVAQGGAHRGGVGIRARQPYVLGDGAGEQMRVLRNPGDPLPPALGGEGGDVPAVDESPAAMRFGEAEQHAQQRGLARAGGADQCDGLAGPDLERGRRK